MSSLIVDTAKAQILTLNFDSVDASSGPVDATAYFASYGITLSSVSPSGTVVIFSDQAYYGSGTVKASSGHSFLLQSNNSTANTYTLNFATPLTSFGFTRIQQLASNLGSQWTATAYSGSTALSSVGEPFGGISFPAVNYTLTGSNITSVTFSANGFGVAGISSATVDDFILNEGTASVPEPSTWAMLLVGFGLLGSRYVYRFHKVQA